MKKTISRIASFVVATALVVSFSTAAFAQESQSETVTKAIDLKAATVSRVIGPYLMSYNNDTRLPMANSEPDGPSFDASDAPPAPPELDTSLDGNGLVKTIPTVLGNITLSDECEIFSNDYYHFFEYENNSKYFSEKDTLTLTMPEGVKAFGFRVISECTDSAKITAKTDDGTTLITNYREEGPTNDNDVENGIAFYSETSDIKSITISYVQDDFRGFALGDIYINSFDIRTLFSKTNKTATGEDFAPEMLKAVNSKDLFMKLIKEYSILKDIKLVQNGNVVTEAKKAGSYDLVLTVNNINQMGLYTMFDELNNVIEPISPDVAINKIELPPEDAINKIQFDQNYRLAIDNQGFDKISEYVNNMIKEEGYSDIVLTTSTIVIKDFIKLNEKVEVIPDEDTPLTPVDNPKTGATTLAVTLMFVAVASVITTVVLKKKAK